MNVTAHSAISQQTRSLKLFLVSVWNSEDFKDVVEEGVVGVLGFVSVSLFSKTAVVNRRSTSLRSNATTCR